MHDEWGECIVYRARKKKNHFPWNLARHPNISNFMVRYLIKLMRMTGAHGPTCMYYNTTYSRKKSSQDFFFIYFQYDIPLKVVRGPTHFWWISTKKSSKLLVLTTCLFQYMSFLHFFPHNEKGRKIKFAKNFSSNTILEIVSTSTYYILPYYHTVVEIA